jgi:hypothetical protein
VEQTADGGYVLAMGSDLIKTDANGITGCGETQFTMTASPLTLSTRTTGAYTTASVANNNAADGSTSPVVAISYCITTDVEDATVISNKESGIEKVVVFDLLGKEVGTWQIADNKSGYGELPLKSGVYFLLDVSNIKTGVRKIVVVK